MGFVYKQDVNLTYLFFLNLIDVLIDHFFFFYYNEFHINVDGYVCVGWN